MMETVIVTGASGFIGSRLALKLLKSGRKVIALGRGNNTTAFHDRVKNVLNKIHALGVDQKLFDKLVCVSADLCEPGLKCDLTQIEAQIEGRAILFHVAGDTSFHPCDPPKQRQINIDGTRNVFKAFRNKVDIGVHVSTAYVAGTRKGLIREDELDKGQDFHNSYEKSKFDAEQALHELDAKTPIPLVIQRPSIIINDSQSGRSSSFTHLNALVEVINRVQHHYHIHDGEVLNRNIRTIRHMMRPDTHPNLAAVDPIVDAMISIGTDRRSIGRTFHLCHPKPQSNAELIDLLAQAFRVKGMIDFPFVTDVPDDLTWTEEMIFRSLKLYLPYMNSACAFDLSNTRSMVPGYDSGFGKIDVGFLEKIVAFQREASAGVH